MLSHARVTIEGFGLIIGYIRLFDTARVYTLQFTVLHTHTHTQVSTVTSTLAVPM
jgi:hypothetical protein